jgi:hypothetical protein
VNCRGGIFHARGAEGFEPTFAGTGMQDSVSVFLCLGRDRLLAKEVPKKSRCVFLHKNNNIIIKQHKKGCVFTGTTH